MPAMCGIGFRAFWRPLTIITPAVPEKAEYWSLNERKVRELKERVLVQGQIAWDYLKPLGFTTWHVVDGWIGCWIERKREASTDSFIVQLEQETPLRFRVWMKTRISKPSKDEAPLSFSRTFDSITSLETDLPKMMKEVIAHVTQ